MHACSGSNTRFLMHTRMSTGSGTAHFPPARGTPQQRPVQDSVYPSSHPPDALYSRVPVQAPAAGSFTVPVTRRREHLEPVFGRQNPSQAGAPHAMSRRASATPESFLPPQTHERTATYSRAQDRTTFASRHAPGAHPVSRRSAQHPSSSPPHPTARFEDEAWPSSSDRFPGLLRHTRRIQQDAQQPLFQPDRPPPRAAEHATLQYEPGTTVASRGGHTYSTGYGAPQLIAGRRGAGRLQGRNQHAYGHSSPLEDEGCEGQETLSQMHLGVRDSSGPTSVYPELIQQALPQTLSQNLDSANTQRHSYQAPLRLEPRQPPIQEVQDISDSKLSADTGSSSPGRAPSTASSSAPAVAVWDTLSAGSNEVNMGDVPRAPCGVWEKLFQQAPAARPPTSSVALSPGQAEDGAGHGATEGLATSAVSPRDPSPEVQEHEHLSLIHI